MRKRFAILATGILIWTQPYFSQAEEASLAVPGEKGELMEIEKGSLVRMEYTLTLTDGTIVDQSAKGSPFEYIQGQGQIISGLERQLSGLVKGDEKDVEVTPEEAYGVIDPNAIQEVQKNSLAPGVEPKVGMQLRGQNPEGKPISAVIKEVKKETLVVDFNHPLAGKTLRFHIKILDVQKIE